MKFYVDADLWLGVLKQDDRHKRAAVQWLRKAHGAHNLVTSTLACLEVWFYLHRNGKSGEAPEAVHAMSLLADVVPFSFRHMENALALAAHHRLTPADAIHATLAMECDGIVSSDSSFDGILQRIDFSKAA